MPLVARNASVVRSGFPVTDAIAEKLKTINPANIDRLSLKNRIPIRTFCYKEERKTPDFRQIDTVRRCDQAATGQYVHTLTAADVASGWGELRSLLNNARTRTFQAL